MHRIGAKKITLFALVASLFSVIVHADVIENLEGDAVNNQGVLTYSVPLALPSSIHDIQPDLMLNYSQSSPIGNVGLGFSIQLSSSISRCSERPIYTGVYGGLDSGISTRYCLDGQPLQKMSDGKLKKFIDDNSIIDIQSGSYSNPLSWRVRDGSGYTYTYDRKTEGNFVTSRWLLTEKSDVFGNKVTFEYNSSDEILAISYPGYRIDVVRGHQSGLAPVYQEGKEVDAAKLIESLQISRSNNDVLYSYKFTYESAKSYKGLSGYRLSELKKCYRGSECTRPLTFSYQNFPQPSIVDTTVADLNLIPDSVIDSLHFSNDDDAGPLAATLTVSTVELDGEAGDELCFYTRQDSLACASAAYPGRVEELASGFGYTPEAADDFRQLNFIDLNADNHPDLCVVTSGVVKCALYSYASRRFGVPSVWLNGIDSDSYFQFVDLNRDGKSDFCSANKEGDTLSCVASNGGSFSVQITNFSGDFKTIKLYSYVSHSSGGGPNGDGNIENHYTLGTYRKFPAMVTDVNGDANADVCSIDETGRLSCKLLHYAGSSELESTGQILASSDPLYLVFEREKDRKKTVEHKRDYNNTVTQSLRFVDVNADGLLDYCFVAEAEYHCSFNAGTRFLPSVTMLDLNDREEHLDVLVASSHFIDINSDGYPDFCSKLTGAHYCAYNQGKQFSALEKRLEWVQGASLYSAKQEVFTNWLRARFDESSKFIHSVALGVSSNPILASDVTGDNAPDLCVRTIDGLDCFSVEQSQPQGLLSKVETPFGSETRFTYVSSSSPIVSDSTIPAPGYLLGSMVVDSGIDDLSGGKVFRNIEYRYAGHQREPVSGVMGFREISRIDTESGREVRSEYYTSGLLMGREKSIQTRVGQRLIQQVDHELKVHEADGIFRIDTVSTRSREYDPGTGGLVVDKKSSFSDIDQFGFARTTRETKAVDTETLTVTTNATYWHNQAQWVLGKPKSVSVQHSLNGESAVTRTTEYEYNSNGSLKQQVIEPDASMKQTVDYEYYGNGTVATKSVIGLVNNRDVQTRSTRYQYDSLGRMTHSTNALGMTERFEYGRCGVERQFNAAGKLAITTEYSNACRKIREKYIDGSWVAYQPIWNRSQNESPENAAHVSQAIVEVITTKADGQRSINYLDRLGRDIRSRSRLSRTSVSELTTDIIVFKQFDQLGRVTAVSSPIKHSNSSSAYAHWNFTKYDRFGRVSEAQSSVGDDQLRVTSFSYDRSSTRQWYSDYEKQTTTNVLGEIAQVEEDGKTLTKEFYSDGSLKRTLLQGHEVSFLQYDSRGNKTLMRDTASGEWQYRFNSFGELYWQKDANGNVTHISYDKGGRKIVEQRTEGASFWSYYTAGSGIGKLQRAQGVDATREYQYDSLGRLSEEALIVDGHTFRTGYRYDGIGRQSQIRYNQGGKMETPISLGYNAAGPLQTVSVLAGSLELFDKEQLQEEYDAMLAELATLDQLIQNALRRVEQHEKQSLYFSQLGFSFSQRKGNASVIAGKIFAQAEKHAVEAAKNRALYEQFMKKSQQYTGETALKKYSYKGLSADGLNHVFSYKYCAKKVDRIIFERCGKTKSHEFRVSLSEMQAYGELQTHKKVCSANIELYKYHPKRGWYRDSSVSRGKQVGTKEERDHRGRLVTVPVYEGCKETELTFSPVAVFERIANHYQEIADEQDRQALSQSGDADDVIWDSSKQMWRAPSGRYISAGNEKPITTNAILYVAGPGGLPIVLPNKKSKFVCSLGGCRRDYQFAYHQKNPTLQNMVEHFNTQASHYRTLAEAELVKASELHNSIADSNEKKAALEEVLSAFETNINILGKERMLQRVSDEQRALTNSNEQLVIWKALNWNANGQLQSELYGNGVITHRQFDPASQALVSISTTAPGNKKLSDFSFEYDQRGQLVRSFDEYNMDESTYRYDNGQLVSWSRSSFRLQESSNYSYDEFGNINHKNSEYSDAQNPFRNASMVQDDKGFVTSDGRRQYSWNSFGKIQTVRQGSGEASSISFSYDADLKRVKRSVAQGAVYYVAPGYEIFVGHDGINEHRVHIRNGNDTVATWKRIERQTQQQSVYEKAIQASQQNETEFVSFYHRDHQGTGTIITGSKAEVLKERYFSPYGETLRPRPLYEPTASILPPLGLQESTERWLKERPGFKETYRVLSSEENANRFQENIASVERDWSSDENIKLLANVLTINSVTDSLRGYTGHEEVEFGLIHMNGRIYDPTMKRFMTPDSLVPDANKPMAYNRYAYVYNNPVNYTDPSGHSAWAIAAAAMYYVTANVYSDSQFHHALSSALLMAATAGSGSTVAGSMAHAAGMSLVMSFAQSGRIAGQELQSAMFAGLSAGVANEIGTLMKSSHWSYKVLAHGVAQGTIGWARGGSFASNFASGAAGHLAGAAMQGLDIAQGSSLSDRLGRTGVAAVFGGLASEATGGSFARGAAVAAVVHLYNEEQHRNTRANRRKMLRRVSETTSLDGAFHEYKISGLICYETASGCNSEYADLVYRHVNANDIPFSNDDLTAGFHVIGPLNDPITHVQILSTRTSVNIAEYGHFFYPGTVTHQVHFRDGGLYYDLTGVGNGDFPWLNNRIGVFLFKPGVLNTLNKFGF